MARCWLLVGCIVIAVCCSGVLSYGVTNCQAYKYVECFKKWASVKNSKEEADLCKGLDDLKNCTKPLLETCNDPSYASQVELQVNATNARVICAGCGVHTSIVTMVLVFLTAMIFSHLF